MVAIPLGRHRATAPDQERVIEAATGAVGDHQPGHGGGLGDPGGRHAPRPVPRLPRSSGVSMDESSRDRNALTSAPGASPTTGGSRRVLPGGPQGPRDARYYASRFPSVEINYTFRRFPTEKTLTTWREQTPEHFRFTLKANQRITHFKRLADTDDDVRDFLRGAGTLSANGSARCSTNARRRCTYERGLIEAFVGYLPPRPRAAMEFRHPSWREARELLLEQGVAWCVAETDEQDPGPDDLSWEPFGFLRLRKTEYSDDEAPRVGRAHRPRAPRRPRRLLLLQARGRGRQPQDGGPARRADRVNRRLARRSVRPGRGSLAASSGSSRSSRARSAPSAAEPTSA